MRKLLFILLLLPLISLAPGLQGELKNDRNEYNKSVLEKYERQDRINEIKSSDFSINLLIEYICFIDRSLIDIPLKQFILETGWFKSDLFRIHNNIAGMKYPKVRMTTAVDTAMGHAKYDHWTDSVDDYIHWRNYWMEKGYCTEDYYRFLRDINYATNSSYENLLRSIDLNEIECNYQKKRFQQS